MAKPHDHLFQAIFADPEHAAGLLRSALPEPLAQSIDWRTLERRNAIQHRRGQRTTLCDVLFAARLRHGPELLLYVVLEHKSQAHRFDALQLLEQVVGVLRTHRREHAGEPFLPPVLPVVVHASRHPWTAPRHVHELFDLEALPPTLHRYLPRFTFLLDDLQGQPPDRLRERALGVFGLCALALLQHLPPAARDPEAFAGFAARWGDVLDLAGRMAQAQSADDVFGLLIDYLLETTDLPNPIVHAVLRDCLTDDTMKKFVSTRTQIRNEGIAEGKAEGIAVGEAKGRAEGQSHVLIRLLERRFGPIEEAVLQRIRLATPDELDGWADRILDAETLSAVFADER